MDKTDICSTGRHNHAIAIFLMARRSTAVLLLLLVLPREALANGAMGLALSIFRWDHWLVYVVVMVLFEAFWIGRALRMPAGDALKKSLRANGITLVLGWLFSGIFGYALYGCFGSPYNPNPLAQSILLLTLGGLASALIEAPVWGWSCGSPWRSTFAAHVLGVPIALSILLLPARPYSGLEAQAEWQRSLVVDTLMRRTLAEDIAKKERFPDARTFSDVVEYLRPQLKADKNTPYLWAIAYDPQYQRFDTGEQRRSPIEWNTAVAGKRLDDVPETVWVMRQRSSYRRRYAYGWIYERRTHRFNRSTDPTTLGL